MKPYLLTLCVAIGLTSPALAQEPKEDWRAKVVQSLPGMAPEIRKANFTQNRLWLTVQEGPNWHGSHDEICRFLNQMGRPVGVAIEVMYVKEGLWMPTPFAELECGALKEPYSDKPVDLGVMGSDGIIRSEAEAEAFEASKKR